MTTQKRNKKVTANKALLKAGLNGFDWAFVQGSTFVLLLNFYAKNPPPSAIPETLPAMLKPKVLKTTTQFGILTF